VYEERVKEQKNRAHIS